MLSTIRDKLLNVKKTVPLFGTTDKDCSKSQVNLNAGCEILSHFQNDWEIIHATSEENAKKAEEAAETIAKISGKIERDKKSLEVMNHLLAHSNLQTNIASCTKDIEGIYDSFKLVEEGVLQLEQLIDDVEFESLKKQHRYHLQQYKLRKEEALKSFEASLKDKHQKLVVEAELKKKKELEERQQVFDEAFKNDVEIFKNFGMIPKLDLPKQPSALLEEIQVDYDENELDQFFAENSTK